MANIRREKVRYGTSLPTNGVFDGEIFVLIVEGSDALIHLWNANDDAWEAVSGDSAAVVAASVAVSGDITMGEGGQIFVDDGDAANPGLASAVDVDTGIRLCPAAITTVIGGTSAAIQYATNFTQVAAAGSYGWNNNLHRMYNARVTVTATELRNLAASPKTVIAAPGTDYYIALHKCVMAYRGGANVFDSVGAGEDLALRYTDGSGTIISTTVDTTSDINFGAVTDDNIIMEPVGQVKPTANAAVVLDNVGAGELAAADNDANGDGIVYLDVLYSVVYLTP
jgi:hypothetical protein